MQPDEQSHCIGTHKNKLRKQQCNSYDFGLRSTVIRKTFCRKTCHLSCSACRILTKMRCPHPSTRRVRSTDHQREKWLCTSPNNNAGQCFTFLRRFYNSDPETHYRLISQRISEVKHVSPTSNSHAAALISCRYVCGSWVHPSIPTSVFSITQGCLLSGITEVSF